MTWRRSGRGLALAGVAGVAVAPLVLPPYLLTVASIIFIAALLAASVNLLAGLVGLVSMGHAGIAAAAAYGIAWSALRDWPLAGQLLLAMLVAALVSLVYAAMTMRTSGIVFLMITLALGVTVFGLALKASSITGGQNGLTGIRRPALIEDAGSFFLLAAAACGLGLAAVRVLGRSPFGLTLKGIRESPSRMSSLGYRVSAAKFLAIVLSGLLAGCAGILVIWQSEFISPSAASFSRSAFAVVMVIVGGTGTVLGPIVGAALVVGIEQWLSSYVERWPTVLGIVLVSVVLFAPRGIVGSISNLIDTRAARSRRAGRSTGGSIHGPERTSIHEVAGMDGALEAPQQHRKEDGP